MLSIGPGASLLQAAAAALLLLGVQIPAQAKTVQKIDLLDEHVAVLDSAADIVGARM